MPDENTNPVWTTQASTSQSWDDFVLDFGEMWDSSSLTSDSSSNSEMNVEWINDSEAGSEAKNEMDLDLNKGDFLDESKKLDNQENNINITDLDTIMTETQNNDFDISLNDNDDAQEIKNDDNEIDFTTSNDENKISEDTENINEKGTETDIYIYSDDKIADDNEDNLSDSTDLQTNSNETEETLVDSENIIEDEQTESNDVVDNTVDDAMDDTEDNSNDSSQDFSISLDEESDLNNTQDNNSSVWEDDVFDAPNQSDIEEVVQESVSLIDWQNADDENIEMNQSENNWPIEASQDYFNDENLSNNDNVSWQELDSIPSSSSTEDIEINDNRDVSDNSEDTNDEVSDIAMEDSEFLEDKSIWDVLNDEDNSSNITPDYSNDEDANDQIKQPELSDLLWNDSDIDFSWESIDNPTQEKVDDIDNSDFMSGDENSGELDINDQSNETNENTENDVNVENGVDIENNGNIEDDASVENNSNVENDTSVENNTNTEDIQDSNFTFDYPENDNQAELTNASADSLWDKDFEQNSNNYNSDVASTDSYAYNSDSLNNWDNENLASNSSESAFVNETDSNTESQIQDSVLDSSNSKNLDSSPDESSTDNTQEISSTLSLDQILDSELNNNPQLSDNSKASPNNVSSDSWFLKSKKIVMLTAWIWVLLAWFVVVLAFPSKNTRTSDTIQDAEIKEYQGISDDPIDDYDHQVAADDQYVSDQESDDESEGGDSDYVINKPSAWWVAIDIPQDFWTDSEDMEDVSQQDSSQSIVKPYIWCDDEDLDCISDFNDNGEDSVNELSIDEIIPEIDSLRSVAENYHSLWYSNRDKILIKYASQAINLCDRYKQQVNSGEMLDEESFKQFKTEFNSIHHKMDSYIWSGNEVETFVQGNFDEEYDFEDKDEVRDYINKKANWLI